MSEPPQRKRRLAKLPAAVAAKLENNQTVELDTADFDELGQAGVIAVEPSATASPTDHVTTTEPKVVIEGAIEEVPPEQPTTVELPKQQPPPEIDAQKDIRTQYVDRVSVENMMGDSEPKRRRGTIIAIYLVVAAVLAISIYYRFG